MEKYTGWEYLLIDAANAFGLDKKLFPERINWAEQHLDHLETLTDQVKPKDKPLYIKAVMAIRNVQAGNISHDLVSLDACCSGIQVMSALTGCIEGARNTGLVDPNVRADAYTTLADVMRRILGPAFQVSREDGKDGLMKMFYGSKAEPKAIFGADTPELAAFYNAAVEIAPGAWNLLQELLASWRPWALYHAWQLPDGFDARIKVMVDKEARITVDELNRASFTYEFKVNEGRKSHVANAANVVHSVDAYILRCIQRRCNYNMAVATKAKQAMEAELVKRAAGSERAERSDAKLTYYGELYRRTNMADVVILPYINAYNTNQLDTNHMIKLCDIVNTMLMHKPFAVITVHDEFKCHPNYMNHLRQHYINIFAELAESTTLDYILSSLYGVDGSVTKLSTNLGELIRNSNYALS